MSDGRTHDKWVVIASPIVIGACWWLIGPLSAAIIGLGYFFGGFMFNGDLDTVSLPYKRWWILSGIWLPYHKLVGKHRSFWSHGPIIGTIVRILWILLLVSPILFWVQPAIVVNFFISWIHELILLIFGLELGALNHIIVDWLS